MLERCPDCNALIPHKNPHKNPEVQKITHDFNGLPLQQN